MARDDEFDNGLFRSESTDPGDKEAVT